MARSGYRGVYETSWGGSWFSAIKHEGRLRYLGTYDSPEEASEAFRKASVSLRGSAPGGEPEGAEPHSGNRQ